MNIRRCKILTEEVHSANELLLKYGSSFSVKSTILFGSVTFSVKSSIFVKA